MPTSSRMKSGITCRTCSAPSQPAMPTAVPTARVSGSSCRRTAMPGYGRNSHSRSMDGAWSPAISRPRSTLHRRSGTIHWSAARPAASCRIPSRTARALSGSAGSNGASSRGASTAATLSVRRRSRGRCHSSMNRTNFAAVIGALMLPVLGHMTSAAAKTSSTPNSPVIHTEDVALFYKLYDATAGHPTADQLQHDYLDPGSDGLHHLAKVRNVTGTSIADAMARHPEIYSDARQCMVVLPRVRQRIKGALRKLSRLYPEARFAPVTIAVGRGKPVGVGSAETGLQ